MICSKHHAEDLNALHTFLFSSNYPDRQARPQITPPDDQGLQHNRMPWIVRFLYSFNLPVLLQNPIENSPAPPLKEDHPGGSKLTPNNQQQQRHNKGSQSIHTSHKTFLNSSTNLENNQTKKQGSNHVYLHPQQVQLLLQGSRIQKYH